MAENSWEIYTLKNGMRIILYPTPNYNHVGIGAYIDFGRHDETDNIREVSHLLEHMIFDGTKRLRTHDRIELYSDKIAGNYSAKVGLESTEFAGTFPDEEVKGGLFLLNELVFNPRLRKHDLEKEKSIIKQEVLMSWDSVPARLGLRALRARFKDKDHPYIFSVGDLLESLSKLTPEKVMDVHKKYYDPRNMILGIYGHFDPKEVKDLVDHYFAQHESHDKQIKRIPFSKSLFTDLVVDSKKDRCEKVYFLINFPGFKRQESPTKELVAHLMLELLVNKRDSKIFSSLRERLGLVYEVEGGFSAFRKSGIFEISTSCDVDHFEEVLKIIKNAIDDTKRGRVDGRKLQRVVSGHQKTVKMELDYPGQALDWILMQVYMRDKIYLPKDYIEIEQEIGKKDIVESAQNVFDWSKANIIISSPNSEQKLEEIAKKVVE